ncbi:MAG: LacI family DNA-binding transcriptional regulator [Opitutaceae bacterium]|nr:LacI family DNA-binding transcriptional regulator [Cephaloticoccus sp.]MCP5530198.1 LacI family DNA-binding transcriptional regulator [Opitutaceae bacterium]
MTQSTPVSPAKPTVLDVAAAADVSVGTVSRVLNTPDAVGPDIRKRVHEAVQAIGYTPLRKRRKGPVAAEGGATHRPRGNLGVLLLGMADSLTHLPVISEALHGVELAMSEEGVNLMLANVPTADRVPLFLAKKQVDGLILKSPLLGDLRLCASQGLIEAINRVPHVWLLGKPDSGEGDMCGADFDVGTRIGVEHLHARGHRRIGYMHPRPGQTRSEGLKRALTAHIQRLGMSLQVFEKSHVGRVQWPLPAVSSPDEVMPMLERWRALPETERPTALIVGADSIAVQVYAALRQLGLRVGTDVSVLSFNHEKPLVMGLSPALTTIDIRAEAIGRRAVQQLLWRIRNKGEDIPTKILVEPRLIEGASVAVI